MRGTPLLCLFALSCRQAKIETLGDRLKKNKGARTMAITCRPVLLKGSAPTATQKAITVYRNYLARQEAQRLNAVVCVLTPAARATA